MTATAQGRPAGPPARDARGREVARAGAGGAVGSLVRRRRGRAGSDGDRRRDADPADEVGDLLGRIREAIGLGGDRLEPPAVAAAEALLARIGDRAALGFSHTVVALAGSTGSGKSSLFNALTGFAVSQVGARRPTTSSPVASVWGDSATPLLDWLEIPSRHRTERVSELEAGEDAPLEGLVLLDMPDHDSREAAHRLDVDRLVELVDVLVWVVDPQKYADEALHGSYLRRLSGHEDVLVVVLNQADTIAAESVPSVRDDLRRLLGEDGLPAVEVVVTSARTGQGVDRLREVLTDAVASRAMATVRARADLIGTMTRLRAGVGDDEAALDTTAGQSRLTVALAEAASVRPVLDAIEADYRRRATQRTGWPPVRWVGRLRPDPLRRIRVAAPDLDPELTALQRSSLPQPTPAQLARVDLAQRSLVEHAAEGLPPRWAEAVRAAPVGTEDLRDALDQAVLGTDLRFRDPRWWRVMGALQALLIAAAVLGGGVLAGLAVVAWLQLPEVELPRVYGVPMPTLLLLGGGGLGLLLAAVTGRIVPGRARARRRLAETRLLLAVGVVARERVLGPVAAVLDDHRLCRDLLTR